MSIRCIVPSGAVTTLLQYPPHLINFPLQFPSCPSPPPLRPLSLPGFRPYLLQIQTLLLPPLHFTYWPWLPLCRHTQAHNGHSRNILRHGVLAEGDADLHLLQPRLQHHILQWGLNLFSVPSLPQFPSCQPAVQPMVKSDQHPLHTRC